MSVWSKFVDGLVAFFAFSTRPVSVLTLATYAAIFVATIWIHEAPPSAPKRLDKQLGLDLDLALRDLQAITTYPHPYNSHQNDLVRSYILNRVKATAKEYSHVQVSDDNLSNATYAGDAVIYFEGTNVLVKIDGKNSEAQGGVLFSAHYDSVSTAPGATDDGMGVATLLNLVDYYAKHRPERDVVFNINNGEEDWLNGAHAYLEHPWAQIPTVFLNLEGAGNGGRPLLFRTSNTGVTKAFRAAHHPHGTVLSADAFKHGVVRSGTDFSVYETAGLKGLDLAFYRKRSRYHTKYDSVAALAGKNSLWAMMEASVRSGNALVRLNEKHEGGGNVVYFDLFGRTLVVLEQKIMLIINIVLLGAGPIVVGVLVLGLHSKGKLLWSRDGWFRFPLAFVVSMAAAIGLAVVYSKFNAYIIYSSSYAVFTSLICASYLSMYAVLRLLSWYTPTSGTETSQRSVVLFQTYLLWWLLLVLDSVVLNVSGIGGLYFFTFYYAGSLAALLIVFLEMTTAHEDHVKQKRRHVEQEDNGHEAGHEEEATERTPLIPPEMEATVVRDSHWTTPIWGVEFLLSAGFPIILTCQVALLLLTALSQTLADGNSAFTVYLMIAVLSTIIILPLAPFIHKIHRIFSFVLIGILIITVVYNLFAFPFSQTDPLKVYFQQTMDLDASSNGSNNTVELMAVPGYLQKYLVPSIPSGEDAQRAGIANCTVPVGKRKGLLSCRFPGLTPNVAPIATRTASGNKTAELLSINVTRISANSGTLKITGANTRSCRIYFDDPIRAVTVDGYMRKEQMQEGYPMPAEGVKEVRLWSRTWHRTFEVFVRWEGKVIEEKMTGKVSCNWSEMRSERIPSLDEVVSFLPTWAVVSKLNDGLVEGFKRFEL